MTIYERPRTDPIAGHAYTLPVVREVPLRAPQATSLDPRGLAAPAVHADSHPR